MTGKKVRAAFEQHYYGLCSRVYELVAQDPERWAKLQASSSLVAAAATNIN
jgi:hypothetical protein